MHLHMAKENNSNALTTLLIEEDTGVISCFRLRHFPLLVPTFVSCQLLLSGKHDMIRSTTLQSSCNVCNDRVGEHRHQLKGAEVCGD